MFGDQLMDQYQNYNASLGDKDSNEDSLYDTNGVKKRNLINLQNFGDYASSNNNS